LHNIYIQFEAACFLGGIVYKGVQHHLLCVKKGEQYIQVSFCCGICLHIDYALDLSRFWKSNFTCIWPETWK